MKDKLIRFRTELLQTGKNTTGIVVPAEIIETLAAGSRPALAVKINGLRYRTTDGVMGGRSMLPFSAEHRAASGLKGGDAIEVEVEVDREPRVVEIPDDLHHARQIRAFLPHSSSSRRAGARRTSKTCSGRNLKKRVPDASPPLFQG